MAVTGSVAEVHGLLDIVPPRAPPDHTLLWAGIMIGMFLVLLLGIVVRRRYFSRRGRARLSLHRQQRRFERGEISAQDAAYLIAAALQAGLGLNQVAESMPLPEKILLQQATWRTFAKQLAQLRYARTEKHVDMDSLFQHAQRWLRIWA